MTCLTLQRDRFVEILGPLEQLMAREKSPQVRLPPNAFSPCSLLSAAIGMCDPLTLRLCSTSTCILLALWQYLQISWCPLDNGEIITAEICSGV